MLTWDSRPLKQVVTLVKVPVSVPVPVGPKIENNEGIPGNSVLSAYRDSRIARHFSEGTVSTGTGTDTDTDHSLSHRASGLV